MKDKTLYILIFVGVLAINLDIAWEVQADATKTTTTTPCPPQLKGFEYFDCYPETPLKCKINCKTKDNCKHGTKPCCIDCTKCCTKEGIIIITPAPVSCNCLPFVEGFLHLPCYPETVCNCSINCITTVPCPLGQRVCCNNCLACCNDT